MNDLQMSEHTGTHLDAPIHFARNGWSVSEIPPERFISPGKSRKINRLVRVWSEILILN